MKFLKRKKKKNNETLKKIKRVFVEFKRNYFDLYSPNIYFMTIPFILMDVFTYIFGNKISYSSYLVISPILFSLTWILLFVQVSLSFKKVWSKIVYSLFSFVGLFLFLLNNVYYSMTKTFFDFHLLESASEGTPYIFDTLLNCNPLVYVSFIIILISIIFNIRKMPKIEENDFNRVSITIVIVFILHLFIPLTYGKANTDLTWSSWRNPRNVYNSFNDNNKSMKITGLFEYSFRNFYVTFLKTQEQENEEDIEFLNSAFKENMNKKNSYTNKLNGKNLILIQLEGTDNWLIDKDTTPTLYKMMNEGINFSNHYSYYNGGGSTFNSEFAVNTGFITPLSYTKNAYSFNKNSFPNSLANLFKERGYTVNAFHMNNGEYYSRTSNYKNWGYDNYYGLIEIDDYKDYSYQLDRELILNEKFNELMFPSDTNFVDYIIAYSGHLPFTNTKGVCKMLYDEDTEKEIILEKEKLLKEEKKKCKKEKKDHCDKLTIDDIEVEKPEFISMSEEECVRRQARETDYMMELLLQNLKEKNLLDNTAIVVFTDHYLYTLNDKTILDKYKTTSNNLINKTPWFIWSSNLKSKKVTTVTSQLNILPTILNLYGFKYNTNNYIGEDALSSKYNSIVFFSDYSWYDGNVYVENGEVKNKKKISQDKLDDKNEYVNYVAKKNDLALKYNYFKK